VIPTSLQTWGPLKPLVVASAIAPPDTRPAHRTQRTTSV